MNVDDFDFELPRERIAQEPAERRDAARLFVHDVASDVTSHRVVADLPDLLAPGDLLVVNDTRVRPVRLWGRRESGGRVELLLTRRVSEDGTWRALVRPARRLAPGERIRLDEPRTEPGGCAMELVERVREPDGSPGRAWIVRFEPPEGSERDADAWLEALGRMPLPPYIERDARGDARDALDRERYQTVYARDDASECAVAAPTAGLHFTPGLLEAVEARGARIARVTLHVGEGTFRPVEVRRVADHQMHAERYELSDETARAIAECRERGGRVVAVGTTTVRVLESCRDAGGVVRAGRGETALFLYPGCEVGVVDGLLTNFHLPRSTLLMLVSAFAGRERMLRLYREAIERSYRFFSYGDAMLLWRALRRE